MELFKKMAFALLLATTLTPYSKGHILGELTLYENMSQAHLQEELNWAIRIGDEDGVKILLMLGADPNGLCFKNACKFFDRAPLALGLRYGNLKIVKLLLQEGADAHRRHITLDKQTPLEWAEARDALQLIDLLKKHGATH